MNCQETTCKNAIIGRSNKKFCSQKCRNLHNNKLNRPHINLIRNINNGLNRNYRILKKLLGGKLQI